jgi:hypothetical protein
MRSIWTPSDETRSRAAKKEAGDSGSTARATTWLEGEEETGKIEREVGVRDRMTWWSAATAYC